MKPSPRARIASSSGPSGRRVPTSAESGTLTKMKPLRSILVSVEPGGSSETISLSYRLSQERSIATKTTPRTLPSRSTTGYPKLITGFRTIRPI